MIDLQGLLITRFLSSYAGTKDAQVQQFVEQVATARLDANQVGDFVNIESYELYPERLRNLIYETYRLNVRSIEKLSLEIHQRFGVSVDVAQKFVMNSARNIASCSKIS